MVGNFLRLEKRLVFGVRCGRAEFVGGECGGVDRLIFFSALDFYFFAVVSFLQVCCGMVVAVERRSTWLEESHSR